MTINTPLLIIGVLLTEKVKILFRNLIKNLKSLIITNKNVAPSDKGKGNILWQN